MASSLMATGLLPPPKPLLPRTGDSSIVDDEDSSLKFEGEREPSVFVLGLIPSAIELEKKCPP